MPYWIYSSVAFSGIKDAVHKLIKNCLENSERQSPGDLKQDFNQLVDKGSRWGWTRKAIGLSGRKGLTARPFLPISETFVLYDTNSNPDKHPK